MCGVPVVAVGDMMSHTYAKTDLISEYYLRKLSRTELQELQDLLSVDEEARAEFVRVGRDEWLLHHMHHAEGRQIIHITSRRSRRRNIQAIAAISAVCATLGVLLFSKSATISEMMASRPTAPVIAKITDYFAVEGEAISVVNNGDVRKLNSASAIRTGDRIIIPPGCQLSFRYLEEQTGIRLGGNSLVHVLDVEGAKRIRLDRGHLSAQVARQKEGRPMRVVTRDAEVVVLGTSFEVVAGEEGTRLSVISGKVQFNSLDRPGKRIVRAGHFADTSIEQDASLPFREVRIGPSLVQTLNFTRNKFMVVDPERNAEGFLIFDIGEVKGTLLEAALRLHVTAWQKEYGGRGDLRLYRVDPDQQGGGKRVPIAHFSGGVGKGKDLVMDLDVSLLTAGRNAFLLMMDVGGNDFWFSAGDTEQAPVLELKISDQR
ncbi:hypothetical protein EGM51_08645 [Verrucomicrobia bacterium S94]|nr:hypothetical protein EGM51_08645 [Verrucomicrobia bacterium S94]